MAQTNTVREPSMDEILASIRRIIESNDPVPSPGLATTAAEPAGFSGEPANDDGEEQEEEVHLTVDEELARREAEIAALRVSNAVRRDVERYISVDAPERVTVVAEEPAPSRPLSLADVAARVRAASERQASNPVTDTPEAVVETVVVPELSQAPIEPAASNPLMTGRMMVSGRITARPEPQVQAVQEPVFAEPVATAPVDFVAAEPEVLAADDDFAAAAAVTLADLAPVAVAEPEPVAETFAVDMPLVSAPVGDQVARSFNELAVAVEMSERRSFDEIAAELMRPMLQEWLDDNLPTLVERLVREEIERVARGPRR